MIDGLLLLSPEVFFYMTLGVLVSTAAVVTPGLGGLFAIAIMLPFAFRLDPVAGIALVLGVNVVSGTGNTITSILFGIPGSASGVASMFDGVPLARRGKGVYAVSAGLMASALGGLVGAAVLAVSLPVLRPIVLAFRSPEFFALIILAMVFMAFVGGSDPLKGLAAGGFGIMVAFIGMEVSTATQRYTFGELYLWEGLPLVPLILGLYAIVEMMDLARAGTAIADARGAAGWWTQMRSGLAAPFRYWPATLQSSIAGLWVGLAPGLGDSTAQFVGYGQVARTSKNRDQFGKGAIEGVIGADAATNSKEGGALIPTLAFGIPGSASMAIVIAAFLAFGIDPGPAMLTEDIDIVWMIIWILVFANLITAAVCLAITPMMAKMTELRASLIVPPILVASLFGAYTANNSIRDVGVMVVFGFVGWVLKHSGYPRSIVLIGFVLGPILEQNYLLATRIYGLGFLARPIAGSIMAVLVLLVAGPLLKRAWRLARG